METLTNPNIIILKLRNSLAKQLGFRKKAKIIALEYDKSISGAMEALNAFCNPKGKVLLNAFVEELCTSTDASERANRVITLKNAIDATMKEEENEAQITKAILRLGNSNQRQQWQKNKNIPIHEIIDIIGHNVFKPLVDAGYELLDPIGYYLSIFRCCPMIYDDDVKQYDNEGRENARLVKELMPYSVFNHYFIEHPDNSNGERFIAQGGYLSISKSICGIPFRCDISILKFPSRVRQKIKCQDYGSFECKDCRYECQRRY